MLKFLDSLYENIGTKIKNIAKYSGAFLLFAGIITGFIFLIAGMVDWEWWFVIAGICAGSGIVLFLASYFAYGYGELIEKTVSIDAKLNGKAVSSEGNAVSREDKLQSLLEKGLISEEEFNNALASENK